MKKVFLVLIFLCLLPGIQGCTSTGNNNQQNVGQNGSQESSEDILKDYHAFIQKFDEARMGDMRPDITKPDQMQLEYQAINTLLIEAESIEQRMLMALQTSSDVKTQAQLKPYSGIITARVATLKTNKATYQSMGAQ